MHEDEFDVERVTLTDTSCPECNSVSVIIFRCIVDTKNLNLNLSNLPFWAFNSLLIIRLKNVVVKDKRFFFSTIC